MQMNMQKPVHSSNEITPKEGKLKYETLLQDDDFTRQ